MFNVAWATLGDGGASVALMADAAETGSGGSVASGDVVTPPQLSAPTRLGWGRDYRFLLELYRKQQPKRILTDDFDKEYVECPGMIYWSTDGVTQGRYRIEVYQYEEGAESTPVEIVEEWKSSGSGTMESVFHFFSNTRAGGDYYFTVRALGDGRAYADSEVAQSEIWTYEAPTGRLTAPARPRWKNVSESSVAFIYPPTEESNSLDSRYRIGYEAQWWYVAALSSESVEEVIRDESASGVVKTETEEDGDAEKEDPTKPKEVGSVLTFYPRHYEFKPSEKMIGQYGSGYYFVQIRSLSGDIEKARPSDWSQPSMVRYIAGNDEDLATIVNRVDKNTDDTNRQLAINNVRKFGTAKLVELMAADANNTGAAGDIQRLEAVTGNEAQIVVSGGLNELFPESSVSVIGAGLNVDLGQTVQFHLGAAHADEVPSTLYSHAVRFSMQLLDTNGASLTPNGTELKVPAKITLPVPDSINPNSLVILHHRMDGTIETLSHVALRKVTEKVKVVTTVETGTSTQSGGGMSTQSGGGTSTQSGDATSTQTQTEKTVDRWYASFIVTNFSDFTMADTTAFLEAKAAANGVSVSYRFRTDGVKTALCAVRDAAGQMIALAPLDLTTTQKTVTIPCDGAADSVKLFLLDANSAPVDAALTVRVMK